MYRCIKRWYRGKEREGARVERESVWRKNGEMERKNRKERKKRKKGGRV